MCLRVQLFRTGSSLFCIYYGPCQLRCSFGDICVFPTREMMILLILMRYGGCFVGVAGGIDRLAIVAALFNISIVVEMCMLVLF